MSDFTLEVRQISPRSDEYKQRRTQQMVRFFGATLFTLASSRLMKKAIHSRQYNPNMFQSNKNPPPYSYEYEATSAFVIATGITTGFFSMGIFGACWIYDISNIKEFNYKLQKWAGTTQSSSILLDADKNLDDETNTIIKELESIFNKK